MWDFGDLDACEDERRFRGAPTEYSFRNPSGHDVPVLVEQSRLPDETAPEDTGSEVWPAAEALARYLERSAGRGLASAVLNRGPSDDVQGRAVLELGAGVGLVGLAARAVGARKVVLTDVAPALPLLARNAELNAELGELAVELLDFRMPLRGDSPARQCDVVCCSDCVLWPQLAVPLQQTLDRLLGPESVALLSVVFRGPEAAEFLGHLRCLFRVEEVWASPAQELQDAGRVKIFRVAAWPPGTGCPQGFDQVLDHDLAECERLTSPRLQQLLIHMAQESFQQESREISVTYPASAGRPGAFRARMLASALVADLRNMCGKALPAEARVLCRLEGQDVALEDADWLPEQVVLSEFRGPHKFYCFFNQTESAVAQESMRLSWQRPELQERLREIESQDGGRTLKSRLARADLLRLEVYPPVISLLRLPKDEDPVRLVMIGNSTSYKWLDTSYAHLEVALMSRFWDEVTGMFGVVQRWHAQLGMPPPELPWDGMDPLAIAAVEELKWLTGA